MKKMYLLVLGIILLSFASSLEVTGSLDSKVIIKEFENPVNLVVNIKDAPKEGLYNVYTLADIYLRPTVFFKIQTGEITKNFEVSPNENLNLDGFYTFTYTLNHRDVEKYDNKLTIKLVNLKDAIEVYTASINPDTEIIELIVENKENVEIKGVKARFSSILFDEEKTFDILPNKKQSIFINVDKEKITTTKAGVYVLKAEFETPKGIKILDGNLYLGEKKDITSTENTAGLVIKKTTVTKVNTGNVLENVQVKISKNIVSRLFTSFNIEPTITTRKGFGVNYIWIKEELGPQEKFEVVAKTNYSLPLIIVLLGIVLIFGLKRLTETKVEVKKSVHHVKTKSGEFALKINLSVMAKKSVENVTLIDKVPHIVKIYPKFGMVKPDKIDAESRRIHWHVGDLNAGEERVFSYIVYSKVGVVGKFSLPSALAVFERDGQIHEVDSNAVFFLSDQIRGD